jgi:hypothetical protein
MLAAFRMLTQRRRASAMLFAKATVIPAAIILQTSPHTNSVVGVACVDT